MGADSATATAHLGDDTIAALVDGGLGDGVAGAGGRGGGSARDLGGTAPTSGATLRGVPQAAGGVAFAPGTVVAGRYRVEHPLGEGGMGRVFAARQVGLERPVAVKILRPELA